MALMTAKTMPKNKTIQRNDGGSSNIYKAVMMNDMEDIDVIEVWMMEICG